MAQPVDVLTPIQAWINTDAAAIAHTEAHFGGWELWAQGQIRNWYDFNSPLVITTSPNCYANGQQADFVVSAMNAAYQDAVIELKVWRKATETANAFAARLLIDYNKVRNTNINTGFSGDRFWSIGISNVEGRQNILTSLNNAGADYDWQQIQGYDVWWHPIDRL